MEVRKTEAFEKWLRGLRDLQTRARILTRIERLSAGHAGDAKAVGAGVWEMRIHFGPGWRVYFVRIGSRIVILLGGGSKSTQDKDVANALLAAKRVDTGDDDES